ncbi:MAG: hypothetical protein SNG04_04480 [Rikenellaceae bacterium]
MSNLRKKIGQMASNFTVAKVGDDEFVYDGETIYEGLTINTYDENGDLIPVSSGTYTIEGEQVDIADGVVVKIEREEEATDPDPIEEIEQTQPDPIDPVDPLDPKIEALQADLTEIKELLQKVIFALYQPLDDEVPQSPTTSNSTTPTKAERILKL